MSIVYITEAHPSVFENGFTTLPNAIHDDPNLSILAKALLWHLLRYATCPGFKHHDSTMRKHLGCGINKLEQLFSELTKAGYVRYEYVRGERGRIIARVRQFTHVAIFTSTIETMGEVDLPKKPYISSTSKTATSPMNIMAQVNHGEILNTDLPLPNTESNNNAQQATRDHEFDEFWKEYPKKLDKKKAQIAFRRTRKKISLESLLEGLRKWKAKGIDHQFWPYAATWLNGERWEDLDLQQSINDTEYERITAIFKKSQQPHY